MVERQSSRKIVIVDLDGTLIKGNSLHLFIRVALKHANCTKKMRMASWLVLRRLRIVSHRKMKFSILSLIRPTENIKRDFQFKFKEKIRPEVTKLLDTYKKEGKTIILATAAPDVYIPWIWDGKHVATKTQNNPHKEECRGNAKLKAINNLLQSNELFEAVITDHFDDIPLLKAGANRNILVEPSEVTIKKIEKLNLPYELL